jgi:hypothetical protein
VPVDDPARDVQAEAGSAHALGGEEGVERVPSDLG